MLFSVSLMDVQGVSCVKVDWMWEELQVGYIYMVMYVMVGDKVYELIVWYDQFKVYIGSQCFYEYLYEDLGLGVYYYWVAIYILEGEEVYLEEVVVVLLDEVLLFFNFVWEQVMVFLASFFEVGDWLELFNVQGQLL